MSNRFAWIVALGLALGAVGALAQTYPTKPIRIIVPFPPVGAADLLTRTIGQKLTEAWGQQIIVENRPGVGGNLGVELAAKAAPDGYTAVMAAVTTNAIGMSTYAKLGYHLERDLAPVALAGNVPHILVAHPTLPARNVKEIITKVNAEVLKILATQEVKDRLLAQGGVAVGGTPEQLAERIKADIAKWGKVARTAGVKIE